MASNQYMSNVQLLKKATEVMMVCTETPLNLILDDLRLTNDSHLTINRILDGQFLQQPPTEQPPASREAPVAQVRELPEVLREQPITPARLPPPAPREQLNAPVRLSPPVPRELPTRRTGAPHPTPREDSVMRPVQAPVPTDVVVLLSSSEDEDDNNGKAMNRRNQHDPPPRRMSAERESSPGPTSRHTSIAQERDFDDYGDYEDNEPYVSDDIPPPLDIQALMRGASPPTPRRREGQVGTPLKRTTTTRDLKTAMRNSQSTTSTNRGQSSARQIASSSSSNLVKPAIAVVSNGDDDPFSDWDFDLHVSPVSYKEAQSDIGDRRVVILSPKSSVKSSSTTTKRISTTTTTTMGSITSATSLSSATVSTSLRRGTSSTTLSTNNILGSAASRILGTTTDRPSISRQLFDDNSTTTVPKSSASSRVGVKASISTSQRDVFDDNDEEGIELWNDEDEGGDCFASARNAAVRNLSAFNTTPAASSMTGNKRKRELPRKPDNFSTEPFDLDSLREWEDVSPSLGRKCSTKGTPNMRLDDDDDSDDELDGGMSLEELLVRHAQERREGRKLSQDAPLTKITTKRTRRQRTSSAASVKGMSSRGDSAAEVGDSTHDDEDDDDDEHGSEDGAGSDYDSLQSTKQDAATRAAERAALKAQKEEEKAVRKAQRDQERERKRLEREQAQEERRIEREQRKMAKEAEKEAERRAVRELRIANRLSTKSESAKEMILCIEKDMLGSKFGKVLQDYLRPLECQVETLEYQPAIQASSYRRTLDPRRSCSIKDMMYWKRAVSHRYDDVQGQFIPTTTTEIELEPFILLYFKASNFATQLKDNLLGIHLDTARREIRTMCNADLLRMTNPTANLGDLAAKRDRIRVLFLIEGMEAYLRSLKRVITKSFQAAVLAKIQPTGPAEAGASAVDGGGGSGGSSAEATAEYELIESELLRLQIEERCLIVHVVDDEEASQVIVALTEQIGYAPYKEKTTTNVCMEGIKSGQNAPDTWIRSLQQISMVTPQIAKSIAYVYPTLRMLYEGYRECSTIIQAEEMLTTVEVVGKRGTVGRAISKRIYDVFMGQDPNKVVA